MVMFHSKWRPVIDGKTFSKGQLFILIDLVIDNSFFRFGNMVLEYTECITSNFTYTMLYQMCNTMEAWKGQNEAEILVLYLLRRS